MRLLNRRVVLIGLLGVAALGFVFRREVRNIASRLLRPLFQEHSVRSRVKQFGTDVQRRLAPDFERAKIVYPPTAIGLVALKEERALQLYAAGTDRKFRFIR